MYCRINGATSWPATSPAFFQSAASWASRLRSASRHAVAAFEVSLASTAAVAASRWSSSGALPSAAQSGA